MTKSRETQGMLLGLVGVIIFSLTLPMTRIVVAEVNPLLNGLKFDRNGAHYRLTLRPWFKLLDYNEEYRIFQDKSVVDIAKQIFAFMINGFATGAIVYLDGGALVA